MYVTNVHYKTENLLFINNYYTMHDVNKDDKSHFNIKTNPNIIHDSCLSASFIQN